SRYVGPGRSSQLAGPFLCPHRQWPPRPYPKFRRASWRRRNLPAIRTRAARFCPPHYGSRRPGCRRCPPLVSAGSPLIMSAFRRPNLIRRLLPPVALTLALCLSLAAQATKQQLLWQKLESSISDTDRELDGVLGVYVEDLASGEHYSLHADQVFAQASS